ncbi:MAG: hypothetical protein M1816_007994 [Peltula sp. TS41687]|nr:MAG: hypothetical protein M1816_007994 [Peltula sp. TS41687]
MLHLFNQSLDRVIIPTAFEKRRFDSSFKLDFDAKVPIPFSVFPSTYRSGAIASSARLEAEVDLPSRVGREDRYSSISATLPRRRKESSRYEADVEEEVTVYEEGDRRPSHKEETIIYEEESRHSRPGRDHFTGVEVTRERHQGREPHRHHSEAHIEIDRRPRSRWPESEIDVTEREYRHRVQRTPAEEYEREYTVVEPHRGSHIEFEKTIVDFSERNRSKMGYYDDDGHYHSFRHGIEKATDRLLHPHHHRSTVREEIYVDDDDRPRPRRAVRENIGVVERGRPANTITIPCHHIRVGDLLILQGRPCQVIRITVSAQTGQYRYLGVDLFTKQLHEESSFVSHPSPSVVVQNMLGPVYKQYRVLDIRDDGRVVAMTETGDVKQGLPVIDQGGLWNKLNDVFADGRGSVRVLVISDGDRELAVDYKVVHGSRL